MSHEMPPELYTRREKDGTAKSDAPRVCVSESSERMEDRDREG